MDKRKRIAAILALLFVVGLIVYGNSNTAKERSVSRAARRQAAHWCSEKYGFAITVLDTRVRYSDFFLGGAYFFTPNPGYGPTKTAVVTALHEGREFSIVCDTATGESLDSYQMDEIMSDLREHLAGELGLSHLVDMMAEYGPASSRYHIPELYTGDMEAFLSQRKVRSLVLQCAGDDFSGLRAEDVLGRGSPYEGKIVLLNYRRAEDVGAFKLSSYLEADSMAYYAVYLDSYAILDNPQEGEYTVQSGSLELEQLDDSGIYYYLYGDQPVKLRLDAPPATGWQEGDVPLPLGPVAVDLEDGEAVEGPVKFRLFLPTQLADEYTKLYRSIRLVTAAPQDVAQGDYQYENNRLREYTPVGDYYSISVTLQQHSDMFFLVGVE